MTTPRAQPWRALEGGIELCVKAQPRARRAGLGGVAQGVDGPRLKVAVSEAPEDGRANRAVCALVAEALAVAPSRVSVAQGASSREKILRIEGDAAALASRLATLL
ncbi:DUF167 family protein [Roseomonas sp. KE2513]|uniref:DUF167 domain-containing protein n=1 Tax=Roseomonas sp. KE2513 TaxID=2479202 RepID=UPI0028169E67|nr:DUF167 family protein [Roseomonas sp. KE2513]